MKKVLIALALFLLTFSTAQAQSENISFIYINGSNTNNEKMTKWFLDGIAKTQKDMVKAFNASKVIQKELLKDGKKHIIEQEVPFYWGDMSQAEIEYLKEDLDITKIFSPHLAQSVRKLIAYCLHDAIWVTKSYNMAPIVRNLHKTVMQEYEKGNSVVLFGYSAGSFITLQYLYFKAPYIEPAILFMNSSLSQAEKEFTKTHDVKDTCLDALVASKLVVLSNENELIPNNNPFLFKKNYAQLDKYTELECIPKGTVEGIVNFASPFALFYSDIGTESFKGNIFNAYMLKYMIENGKFILTVNYAEDPMGVPIGENATLDQFEVLWGKNIIPGGGFIYDKSNAKTSKTFVSAHTSYWATSKKFAKTVVKAYEEGREHFYKNSVGQSALSEAINGSLKNLKEKDSTYSEYSFGSVQSEE